MNFRQLDLNLLRVLCTVYRTGSVTEAGRQLALSQPAVSNALARLRRSLADDLFVRSPTGLHPTRLAQRLAPQVEAHLRDLEATLVAGEPFDPAHGRVSWRLSLSDLGEMMFLPPLARLLRSESRLSQIANVSVDAARVSAALEAREIDLAIGILLPEHRSIASELLFQERFVAITSREWRPAAGRVDKVLTTRQLAAAALAVAAPTATAHASVEKMLGQLKLTDRAVVRVRHYGALPELVSCTDLLAIVPQMFADAVVPRHAVRLWELPGQGPREDVRMMWHRSVSNDAAHAWLTRKRAQHVLAHRRRGAR